MPPAVVTILTPRGRGAVATLRVDGRVAQLYDNPDGLFGAANGRSLDDQPVNRIVFGRWGGESAEDVVVCRTGEQTCEIHCHGGDTAVGRIRDDLQRAGCRVAAWTDQSTANGGILETECRIALTQATTLRTAGLLLNQAQVLPHEVESILRKFPKSDSVVRINDLIHRFRYGIHLTRPWDVVLTGRPNVGKSSLLNALAGFERAIVFDQPGTTRDTVSIDTAFDGWPVRLTDTAGLRPATDDLEREGIRRAGKQLENADCRLVVIDVSVPATDEDRELIGNWPDAIVVGNKHDLGDSWEQELPAGSVLTSAVHGDGLDQLIPAMMRTLIPDCPAETDAIPFTERQYQLLSQARDTIGADDDQAVQLLRSVVA